MKKSGIRSSMHDLSVPICPADSKYLDEIFLYEFYFPH